MFAADHSLTHQTIQLIPSPFSSHHSRGWALLSSAMHHPDMTHGLQERLRLAVGIPPAAVAMPFADANAPRVLLQAPTHDE